jgi:hypothetical protein
MLYELRRPGGEVVLRGEGVGFIDQRSEADLPPGDYEQYLSLDGGKTWRRPLYFTHSTGWRLKLCPGKSERAGGFSVPCGRELGHSGSCR